MVLEEGQKATSHLSAGGIDYTAFGTLCVVASPYVNRFAVTAVMSDEC